MDMDDDVERDQTTKEIEEEKALKAENNNRAANGDRTIDEKKASQNDETKKVKATPEEKPKKEAGSQAQPLDKEGDNTVETEDPAKNDSLIPSSVSSQYSEINGKFYQKNADKKDKPIFVDKGNKLQARNSNPSTAKALVSIAQARSWDKIKVNGNNEFRREAWLEASARGLGVTGYKPSEADLAALAAREKEQPINEVSNSENENESTKEVSINTTGKEQEVNTETKQAIKDLEKISDISTASSLDAELIQKAAIIKGAEKFSSKLKEGDRERFVSEVKNQVSERDIQAVTVKEVQQVKAQEQQSER